MEEISGGQVGPFEDLEVIRLEAGMSTSRFVKLIDMPERTWRRWQAKARQDRRPKGPWPQPARSAARDLVVGHALAKPVWGHRKIWALTRHDGHKVSQATVLRLLRDEGLLLASQYQKQRRELAADRRAAFAKMPDGPNQVWQLDFSEFETTTGGTWRIAHLAVDSMSALAVLTASRGSESAVSDSRFRWSRIADGSSNADSAAALREGALRPAPGSVTAYDHFPTSNPACVRVVLHLSLTGCRS